MTLKMTQKNKKKDELQEDDELEDKSQGELEDKDAWVTLANNEDSDVTRVAAPTVALQK